MKGEAMTILLAYHRDRLNIVHTKLNHEFTQATIKELDRLKSIDETAARRKRIEQVLEDE